ncbi:chemotaxis protein CheW [Aliivibrio fischeri]|uniref:chemotaxis protein CheW n=1 Tax=Aliivibrio fischeri TaxID=668 RepID=UPI00107E7F13|nr:chemotaxis protein CheW [Aliivibrio fischeri]TGA70108.1 chemotaxis protein CheW [Aliivibrio fischeri]
MADFKTFTSEEALDDYFSSLLDEDVIEQDVNLEEVREELVEPEPVADSELEGVVESEPVSDWQSDSVTLDTPEPQYQLQASPQVDEYDDYPFEMPQLEDVQRLLSQLENSQLNVQDEIDALVSGEIEKTESDANEPQPITEEEPEELDLSAWDLSDKIEVAPVIEETESEEIEVTADIDNSEALETQAGKAPPPSGLDWKNAEHQEEFQVLFFEVMGVMFAVPLAELGGIHQITEFSHLIGRPDWYLGLQTNRELKIDALDTAKWVMPQSIKDESYKEDYQYLVMLGESKWGLACNALAGTETLTSDRIRWRETAGKRPWLSGMVKEKMCALIHVEAMIAMLNAGLDIKGIE